MKEVSTIGLDLAKNVFQVHGVDGSGETVIRRQLRRGQVLPFFKKLPPCLVPWPTRTPVSPGRS
jgi:transposase